MKDTAPGAPPSVREELNRKCIDMLTALSFAVEGDHIEPVFAQIEAHAIWTLTAGLVDGDISNMAEQLATQTAAAAKLVKDKPECIYLRDSVSGSLLKISYPFNGPGYTLDFLRTDKGLIQQNTPAGPERRKALQEIIKTMVAKGYQII